MTRKYETEVGTKEVIPEAINLRADVLGDSWDHGRRSPHLLKNYPGTSESIGITVTHTGMEGKTLRKSANCIFSIFTNKEIRIDRVVIRGIKKWRGGLNFSFVNFVFLRLYSFVSLGEVLGERKDSYKATSKKKSVKR